MTTQRGAAIALTLCLAFSATSCRTVALEPSSRPVAAPVSLQDQADELAGMAGIPAAGLGVMSCQTQDTRLSGRLRSDGEPEVDSSSRFAIGSNAKSMLATAAARLAERSELSLDSSIAEIWPAMARNHPDKAAITLAQLLGHASGLPAFDSGKELRTVPEFSGAQREISTQAAKWFLAQPLENEPGTATVYSNAGYVVAAELLARVAGKDFRQVVKEEVFAPLGIDASYGEPRRLPGPQPFGHLATDDGVAPYTDDEPPIPVWLEGAGNVAITVADYARYVRAHLCALQGQGQFLSQASAERLHTPAIAGGAALGWGRTELGGSMTSFHIGGTGDFTAYMALVADKDRAAVAVMNVGGAPAAAGQTWLISTMTAD